MTCSDERKETTGIGSFIVERVDGGSLCTQAVGGVQFAGLHPNGGVLEEVCSIHWLAASTSPLPGLNLSPSPFVLAAATFLPSLID